jgi:hypothetical protein
VYPTNSGNNIIPIFIPHTLVEGPWNSRGRGGFSTTDPTSFPGLSYEDEARHEKALIWAGHVTTQKMAVFDSYSSRSGEIFFNEIYKHKSSKQISKQPKDFSIDIIYV